MTLVIISGSIDLSVGSVIGMTALITCRLIEEASLPSLLVVLIVLLIGAVFGLAMGLVIQLLKIPVFLVTLVGLFFARGMCYVISAMQPASITKGIFPVLAQVSIPFGPRGQSLHLVAIIFLVVLAAGV